MAGGKSIKQRKGQIKEISSNLEHREQQVSELEGKYERAMDARMSLENIEGLDDEAREHFRELSAKELELLHEEGKELSDEMMDETHKLEEVRQENVEAMSANQEAKGYAQAFDKETGGDTVSTIDQQADSISKVTDEINEAQKKIDDLSNRARNLSKRGGGSF